MAENRTYYKPGLLFLSKAPGYVLHMRDATFHTFPNGEREQDRPALVADFGAGLTRSVSLVNADGERVEDQSILGTDALQRMDFADLRGGAFSLDDAADAYDWTDEEKEWAARQLIRRSENPAFNDFKLYEPPTPSAPWPTYDDTHHNKIAVLADELGLVVEAVHYERANKNRQSVIDQLNEKLADKQVEAELTVA